MAQGKMKVKAKVPEKKGKGKKKGAPATQRANKPIQSKKHRFEDSAKLKKAITKSLNKAVEKEIRERAIGKKHTLSKAQEAVVAHHQNIASSSKS